MTFTARFGIGTTTSNVVSLASLGVADPMVQPDPYYETVVLGDGQRRGIGGPHILWEWGYLGDPFQQSSLNIAREALRDYIAGASASVVIVTPTNENDATAVYSAIAYWPFPEERNPADVHRRLNFKLEFRNCIVTTLP